MLNGFGDFLSGVGGPQDAGGLPGFGGGSMIPSLSGGSASSGSTTGDVYIPPELFNFPEYPAALAASQQFGGSGASFNINPVTVAVIVAGIFALKKWGG